ncbi:MAG: BexD/CtrA/VexA family polysaccharide export protein [Bacteroidetes bacterium]|nr:MAG: BexD/CtrA/VexA family polysaccharide export protein [Bacteroidota bacterium]
MKIIFRLLIVFSIVGLFSCKTQKQVQYLQGSIDTTKFSQVKIPEPVIQRDDLLGITVYSDNPEATAIYNQQMVTSPTSSAVSTTGSSVGGFMGAAAPTMPGYLVDQDGDIHMQSLGALHVEGLTKSQLGALLKEKLSPFLKNVYFNIRFLNFKITVLGEVGKQGVYTIPGDRVNILEVLGMAGDLTIYGMKDSVMVIREGSGKREFGRVDVSSPDLFVSPYYYLKQNDIILVKSNPKKPTVSEQVTTRNLAIIATIATIITSVGVLISLFK